MPQAERINSYTDIMNRPVYREILDLLRERGNDRAMTLAEIKGALFPLQATSVNYNTETGQLEYTDYKYYPTMKDQALRGYLNTLYDHNLLKKILNPDKGKSVSYRAHNKDEFLAFIGSLPQPTFEEILPYIKPENLQKIIKKSDYYEHMGFKMKGAFTTRSILTDKTKKFKADVVDFLHKTGQNSEVMVIVKYGREGRISL